MQSQGQDTEGKRYKSADDMWRQEVSTPFDKGCWYQKGIDYWDKIEASVDGVLGGFGTISPNDLKHSQSFLLEVFGDKLKGKGEEGVELVAADCGAGVGRITKGLLSKFFTEVDVIEPVQHFLSKAEESLTDCGAKVNCLLQGLQEVEVRPDRYDVVWIQWCIGHLTDDDCVEFLKTCSKSLKKGGMIVVKENNARKGFVLDKEDSSVTRSDSYLVQLFQKAGLKVVTSSIENDLPVGLFVVRAYALVPGTV
ncbi:alpha-N-methyltransferase [Chloropicon primus]|uniref:Alpha N-terminal protein methyltransferase 1 n=1 Tax=Chloropicon primus TaxID=1764295 RepID=A0A5B8MY21_9CHLO|nr:alpha-N-methyltransferase [Chloropicon primus]UPR04466.1 alpha-N-methyltransferase [Chloropicon primus]|mmetsp:Transcript_19148/g.40105  ORF Transcript_19148/g.40105 Transcript_19148/m.40105 type:complete len:252 (-) Transcript_19148:102-857(-)|eukprot:QDZ25261.1 alpha-N-methyltransferase [Chloropicon primus]